jgi:hypothetical protein
LWDGSGTTRIQSAWLTYFIQWTWPRNYVKNYILFNTQYMMSMEYGSTGGPFWLLT